MLKSKIMTIAKYLNNCESLKGKTVVLTGGTSGIGKALSCHVLAKGASLILLARNIELANKTKEELINKYKDAFIDIIEYDQTSFKSIENGVNELINKYPNFDFIVLNAGVLAPNKKKRSSEGYPLTIATNYLGVRHLIEFLTPKLNNHLHRYIIAGSIAAGIKVKASYDIFNSKYNSLKQYNISKACIEAYFYEISSNNKNENIQYVLTEPGISGTNIIKGLPLLIRFLGKYFLKIFFHSPKKAALCQLRAMQSDITNGDYIIPRGPFSMSGYPIKKEFPVKRKREFLLTK